MDPSGNILSDENEILSRWREYFEDILNPMKAIIDDTHHEPTCFREKEDFTGTDVAVAISRVKSGKVSAGLDYSISRNVKSFEQ